MTIVKVGDRVVAVDNRIYTVSEITAAGLRFAEHVDIYPTRLKYRIYEEPKEADQ